VLVLFLFVIPSCLAEPTHPDDVLIFQRVYNNTGGPNWTAQPNLDDPCSTPLWGDVRPIGCGTLEGGYLRITSMYFFFFCKLNQLFRLTPFFFFFFL